MPNRRTFHYPNLINQPLSNQKKTIKSYSNFVYSNDFGVPLANQENSQQTEDLVESNANSSNEDSSSESKFDCWLHLCALFYNSAKTFNQDRDSIQQIDLKLPIILIAFSKGCVCLNQLCNELSELKMALKTDEIGESDNLRQFYTNVKHLFWLDGGHSGGSDGKI
jgi:hypothetical protein